MIEEPACGPLKDEEIAHPVAREWRSHLTAIVSSLSCGDHALARVGEGAVAVLSKGAAESIGACLGSYGETLAELPAQAWDTSVAQWEGGYWSVIVDLWTVESGESDLVMSVRVFEQSEGFRFEVDSVFVP